MNNMIFSILLIISGLIVGFGISFIINLLRGNIASKKAESIINQAKKDADKIKRDSILEQKEESHRLKMDLDKEIREKKEETHIEPRSLLLSSLLIKEFLNQPY